MPEEKKKVTAKVPKLPTTKHKLIDDFPPKKKGETVELTAAGVVLMRQKGKIL